MPAPVLNCGKCHQVIVYNPDFHPTRCPRCHQSLKNASEGALPHVSESGLAGYESGTPEQVMETSDQSAHNMSTRQADREIRHRPVTDREIAEKTAAGKIDDVR